MGTLLRLIGLRDLRVRRARTALAVGGVALGVALVLAIQMINQATLVAFRRTIEGTAGNAQLQVVASSESGLPEAVLDAVRAAPGVTLAVPFVEGSVFVADGSGESLTVFGVDVADEGSVRAYEGVGAGAGELVEDPLVFLAQADSIVVTRAFAAARSLELDGTFPVMAVAGRRTLTVRGLLDARGIARAYGSGLGIMDIFAAQRLLGKDGRFDRIDVVLAAGVTPEAAASALAERLPTGLTVERPEQRGQQVEAMLRAFQSMLGATSGIALMVAMFVIYNSLATVVVERRHESGVLRAVGACRRQVLGLHLGGVLCTGAAGALVGCGLGVVLAHVLVGTLTGSAAVTFGLPLVAPGVSVTPAAVAVAVGAGLVAAVMAGVLPAVTASRATPLEAVRQHVPPVPRRFARGALLGGLALGGLAALALWAESRTHVAALGHAANLGLEAGLALLCVPAVQLSARALRPLAARVFGVSGWLAGESSLRMPLRTATTVAALALGLSMSSTVAIVARSFKASIGDWVTSWADRDLFVTSSKKERGLVGMPLAEALGDGLRAVPGVARVDAYRLLRQRYADDSIGVSAISDATLAGDIARVSDSFALRYRKGAGDEVTLETPTGPRSFRITAVVRDYSSDRGTIIIGYPTFREAWGDGRVTHFRIDLAPGANPAEARAEIFRRFGAEHLIQVLEPHALRAELLTGIARTFRFMWGVEAMTLLVAFLGVLDTLFAGLLARRREIGVLRAIGCRRQQVAAAFGLEGLQIGLLGAGLGIVAGVLLAAMWIVVLFRDTIGYLIDVHLPGLRLGMVVLFALTLAAAAAALPARRAARLTITRSLAYE
jgi:putative ABC transport system permease protein